MKILDSRIYIVFECEKCGAKLELFDDSWEVECKECKTRYELVLKKFPAMSF